MSQNRHAEKDRLDAEHDYEVSLANIVVSVRETVLLTLLMGEEQRHAAALGYGAQALEPVADRLDPAVRDHGRLAHRLIERHRQSIPRARLGASA